MTRLVALLLLVLAAPSIATAGQIIRGGAGGSDTQCQFNDHGLLAGDPGCTYNKTTNVLSLNGSANSLNLAGSSTGNPVTLTATGTDADVDVWVKSKGIGEIWLTQDGVTPPATFIQGGTTHPLVGFVEIAATHTTMLGSFGLTSTLNVNTIVDPSSDDPSFNQFAGLTANVSVPSSNSKVMYNVIGVNSNVSFAGTSGAGNTDVIGSYGLAEATSAVLSLEGVTGAATNYADATFTRGVYAVGSARGGTVDWVVGTWGTANAVGAAVTANDMAMFYAANGVAVGGATIGTTYAYYAENQTTGTNQYAFWYDSPGVFRIKGDGVMAYYNPTFTKYTPGAANFERIVQQWNSNVAEIGTEVGAGGGNVLRPVRIIGAHLLVEDLKTTGAAGGKNVVCADTTTGQVYTSSTGTDCSN
jgi:hypothetical protein